MPPPTQPPTTGTLALAEGSDARLGGLVSFDYSIQNQPGGTILMIGVSAFQNGQHVYTDAIYLSNGETQAKLGGAASASTMNGGPATVVAQMYWRKKHISQPYHPVEGAVVTFEAAG